MGLCRRPPVRSWANQVEDVESAEVLGLRNRIGELERQIEELTKRLG